MCRRSLLSGSRQRYPQPATLRLRVPHQARWSLPSRRTPGPDFATCGQPRHEPSREWIADEADLDGDTLDDADEVTGRVVGGDQAEGCPAARREAVDDPLDCHVRITVDLNPHRLSRLDVRELCFLEIGDHIDRSHWHDVQQRCPRCDETSGADLPVADDAIDRRTYLGIVEIDFGEVACGL